MQVHIFCMSSLMYALKFKFLQTKTSVMTKKKRKNKTNSFECLNKVGLFNKKKKMYFVDIWYVYMAFNVMLFFVWLVTYVNPSSHSNNIPTKVYPFKAITTTKIVYSTP